MSESNLILYATRTDKATNLYDLKMEVANDLKVMNHSLEDFGFEHTEYFQIVRNLIEEYRILFIDWVSKFDKWICNIQK